MHARSALRAFAGLGVVAAFVATTAIPAAARAAAELSVFFSDTTVAADGPGKVEGAIMYASEPVVLHQPTMRFDATDLAGLVKLEEQHLTDYCTEESAGVLVCQDPFDIEVNEFGYGGIFDIVLTAAEGAATGSEGTLKLTLSAPGFAPVTTEARVRVGEGVDLAAGAETTVSAAPGAVFTAPMRVRNAGESVATGAVALFYNDRGIESTEKYSNCTYAGDELRTCTFDADLAPGTTYTAPLKYRLRGDAYAPGVQVGEVGWMTVAEYEDLKSFFDFHGVDPGKAGDGPELTLSATSSSHARGAQADTDPSNNWSHVEVKVTGKNGVDLEAVGATFDGAAGTVHEAELGVVNNGPAALDSGRGGEPITRVKVEVPPGTTATEAPEDCFPVNGDQVDWENPGKPGARAYFCNAGLFLAPEEKLVLPFAFRIDQVVADAAGAITVNAPCECSTFPHDLDKSNDTAKILVNGAGGGGGGLPVTGASTGLVAGAGALLLAAGAVGFVIARRRRMRFVA